uniref:Uncharacterized protein n=1 Tax=Anguilla anguilla TaxID=7936 RepID=A0A0E9RAK1_ANGAN
MCFATGDKSQIKLIFIVWDVITVDRLPCGLLQCGQVHYGTSHHINFALPWGHHLVDLNTGRGLFVEGLDSTGIGRSQIFHNNSLCFEVLCKLVLDSEVEFEEEADRQCTPVYN